jgi:hypothetical protein
MSYATKLNTLLIYSTSVSINPNTMGLHQDIYRYKPQYDEYHST